MAYVKKNWVNRVDTLPNTYFVDTVQKIITKDNSGLTTVGTDSNALNMNNIENGVEANDISITDLYSKLNGYALKQFYGG